MQKKNFLCYEFKHSYKTFKEFDDRKVKFSEFSDQNQESKQNPFDNR